MTETIQKVEGKEELKFNFGFFEKTITNSLKSLTSFVELSKKGEKHIPMPGYWVSPYSYHLEEALQAKIKIGLEESLKDISNEDLNKLLDLLLNNLSGFMRYNEELCKDFVGCDFGEQSEEFGKKIQIIVPTTLVGALSKILLEKKSNRLQRTLKSATGDLLALFK